MNSFNIYKYTLKDSRFSSRVFVRLYILVNNFAVRIYLAVTIYKQHSLKNLKHFQEKLFDCMYLQGNMLLGLQENKHPHTWWTEQVR